MNKIAIGKDYIPLTWDGEGAAYFKAVFEQKFRANGAPALPDGGSSEATPPA